MKFRRATLNDLTAICSILTDAFIDYEHCTASIGTIFTDRADYTKYLRTLFSIDMRVHIKTCTVLVGEVNGEVVTCAILKRPHQKKISMFTFLRYGLLKLCAMSSMRDVIKIADFFDRLSAVCKSEQPDSWYLDILAVRVADQGKGYGTSMLQECIFPYVNIMQGCDYLTLCTGTLRNVKLYEANGFKLINKQTVSFDSNSEIVNYSLLATL